MKDFDGWNQKKKRIELKQRNKYPKVRSVWWCNLGLNIGHEQDGRGQNFDRPVLILKKFNNKIFLCVPMTKTLKNNKYYFKTRFNGQEVSCLISQLRLIDSKRLYEEISVVDKVLFENIRKAVRDLI